MPVACRRLARAFDDDERERERERERESRGAQPLTLRAARAASAAKCARRSRYSTWTFLSAPAVAFGRRRGFLLAREERHALSESEECDERVKLSLFPRAMAQTLKHKVLNDDDDRRPRLCFARGGAHSRRQGAVPVPRGRRRGALRVGRHCALPRRDLRPTTVAIRGLSFLTLEYLGLLEFPVSFRFGNDGSVFLKSRETATTRRSSKIDRHSPFHRPLSLKIQLAIPRIDSYRWGAGRDLRRRPRVGGQALAAQAIALFGRLAYIAGSSLSSPPRFFPLRRAGGLGARRRFGHGRRSRRVGAARLRRRRLSPQDSARHAAPPTSTLLLREQPASHLRLYFYIFFTQIRGGCHIRRAFFFPSKHRFCRPVRETLTELDLAYRVKSAGKGSPRRQELCFETPASNPLVRVCFVRPSRRHARNTR